MAFLNSITFGNFCVDIILIFTHMFLFELKYKTDITEITKKNIERGLSLKNKNI